MHNVRRTDRGASASQALSFVALVALILGALLVLEGPAPAKGSEDLARPRQERLSAP